MKLAHPSLLVFALALFILSSCSSGSSGKGKQEEPMAYEYALVLHGGAGYLNPENLPEPRRTVYEQALDSALSLGLDVLNGDGSSLDAVETVIRYMEDNPFFNAGRGAVFTNQGINELDASIMSGSDLNAGAVAGVRDVRHPISAARAVMEHSEHVMLSGQGASDFAEKQGLELVDPSYFHTESRMRSLHKAWGKEKHGTVGCVALDRRGNLAAGTGHGEYFIRWAVAHDISALMEYKGMDVEAAAKEVVENKLANAGGSGGVICLDRFGRAAMITNTSGMFRAYGNSTGEKMVAIFK